MKSFLTSCAPMCLITRMPIRYTSIPSYPPLTRQLSHGTTQTASIVIDLSHDLPSSKSKLDTMDVQVQQPPQRILPQTDPSAARAGLVRKVSSQCSGSHIQPRFKIPIQTTTPATTTSEGPEPILRLRNVLIRPYHESDVESLTIAGNNSSIARWMRNSFPQPYKADNAKQWIKHATSLSPTRDFAITKLDSATVIGGIGLKFRDDIHYRTMEVGYWLAEDHWHKGIATEALGAFSDWAFDRFETMIRLEAEVFSGNAASGRVLEKAGFELEARIRNAVEKWGVIQDVLLFARFRNGY